MSEQNDNTAPPTTTLSGLSLNPNAGTFIPRAAAKPFVPSWMPQPAAEAPPAPPTSSGIDFNRPPPAAVLNKTVETSSSDSAPAPTAATLDFNRPPPAAVLNKTVDTTPAAPKPVPAAAAAAAAAPVAKPASPAPKAPTAEAPKKKVEAAPKAPAAAPPAPVEEEEDAVDQETLTEFFGKEHVNVIFIGHVDAGKSTMGGRIL
ncbi:translation termination factor GTPase eRF3 [Lobosporangium transversale]|nr:translation termination factor GTPase eRF3 [Lobosporangium transversale]